MSFSDDIKKKMDNFKQSQKAKEDELSISKQDKDMRNRDFAVRVYTAFRGQVLHPLMTAKLDLGQGGYKVDITQEHNEYGQLNTLALILTDPKDATIEPYLMYRADIERQVIHVSTSSRRIGTVDDPYAGVLQDVIVDLNELTPERVQQDISVFLDAVFRTG